MQEANYHSMSDTNSNLYVLEGLFVKEGDTCMSQTSLVYKTLYCLCMWTSISMHCMFVEWRMACLKSGTWTCGYGIKVGMGLASDMV